MLLAANFLQVVVSFIDLNYEENKDIIMLAIDANLVMFNLGFLPTHDLVLLLASLGLLERLSIVVDFLY